MKKMKYMKKTVSIHGLHQLPVFLSKNPLPSNPVNLVNPV